MRLLLGFIWMAFLFICTCTLSMKRFMYDGSIRLRFTLEPDWPSLLTVSDINLHHSFYVVQKIGHFSGFFILSLILTSAGRKKAGMAWAIGYAVLTEILQLYFNRDGRIVDMFIDTAGIMAAYALGCVWQRLSGALLSPELPPNPK